MSTTKTKTEHSDIKFLKIRLQQLLDDEEYEICATIHKWIQELTKHYDTIKNNK